MTMDHERNHHFYQIINENQWLRRSPLSVSLSNQPQLCLQLYCTIYCRYFRNDPGDGPHVIDHVSFSNSRLPLCFDFLKDVTITIETCVKELIFLYNILFLHTFLEGHVFVFGRLHDIRNESLLGFQQTSRDWTKIEPSPLEAWLSPWNQEQSSYCLSVDHQITILK